MKDAPIDALDNSLFLNDLYEIVRELLWKGELPPKGGSCFWVIGMSQHHQLLLMERVYGHSLEEVLATEVFEVALQKRAASILLCQLSDDPEQVLAINDHYYIRQLMQVGYLIDLPILDYLILKTENYYSLMQSSDYQQYYTKKALPKPPMTVQKAETMAQEAVEQAKHALETNYYQEKEEIALHLYEEGISLEQIIDITGLPEETLLTLFENNH